MDASAPGRIAEIRRRLLAFYDDERRDLPWRGADDPYRVWVSEVMLQQTRVKTVIPYYRRWMERFPDVDALAEADLDDVLQVWKGLGYYSRARRLHRAARLVRERHDGKLPGSADQLRELPGVGEYTAGAVASIAFERPVPAVDGNARRVLARLFDLPDPGPSELRDLARDLVDPERPGAFNQALMELGARICQPTSPACSRCPVGSVCLALERGTVAERPPSRDRPEPKRREVAVAVPVDGRGRTLLVRRPEEGLLGGMWEFPQERLDDGTDAERVARRAAESRGAVVGGPPDRLDEVPHAFSHLRVTYHPFVFPATRMPDRKEGVRIVGLDALNDAPLPVAQQKIGRTAAERR